MSIKIVKGSYSSVVDSASLSGNQTLTLPNASGTVALTNQFATVATTGSYNDLSDKPTIPGEQNGYVTEIWKNEDGTSWYRVWSDGWIEQGGFQKSGSWASTLTFVKSFTTRTYSIGKFTHGSNHYNKYNNYSSFYSMTETTATTTNNATDFPSYSWYACGY